MDHKTKSELKKCRNVLIQSNDPRFNYSVLKEEDIDDFEKQPQIITLNQYDYSFKKDDGDDTHLPTLTSFSLLASSQNIEDLEEWYRQKYPRLPEEYYGVMARYTTGQKITKKEAKNKIKKFKKNKDTEPPVGFKVIQGNFKVEFD